MAESNQNIHNTFEVSSAFGPYIDAAVIAFERSYPQVKITVDDGSIRFADAPAGSRQQFLHFLYREKIYQETLDLRRILYQRLGQ
tara:strand:+ start:3557 stop:3811 length:255 start_codon:yes stop_codon:yes gene_type:complete